MTVLIIILISFSVITVGVAVGVAVGTVAVMATIVIVIFAMKYLRLMVDARRRGDFSILIILPLLKQYCHSNHAENKQQEYPPGLTELADNKQPIEETPSN